MIAEDEESAVLLVAHGSRVPESNSEIGELAARLSRLSHGQRVAHAFLEMSRPSIPDAIDALADAGVQRLVLIPYFLSGGRHVMEDIPAIAQAARARHPELNLVVTAHFGALASIPELLSDMVSNAPKAPTDPPGT
ncbi:MAG: CbiX/SirB N-terminal domain-containing protein [Arenicellales bacterium]|jgi:sirohydrochlorin ferrochelatase